MIQFVLILGLLVLLPPGAVSAEGYSAEEREHWSLQPRLRSVVPVFSDPGAHDWARNPIDAFVLRRLRDAGLRPAANAERSVLARRLYLHLTGLLPTPGEIDSFVADHAADAYERLVDRLLASPHYGEQWGQNWLDVVRYAESEGFEYDRHRAGAWRFRDYVVRSLNADKPYDRFVLEQLAGDELDRNDEDSLVAAGFYRLGPVRRNAGNTDVANAYAVGSGPFHIGGTWTGGYYTSGKLDGTDATFTFDTLNTDLSTQTSSFPRYGSTATSAGNYFVLGNGYDDSNAPQLPPQYFKRFYGCGL